MATEPSPASVAASPSDQLIDDASEWIGISTAPHRFNAVEFNLDDYEVGHVHQGGTLDINFPKRMRDALIEEEARRSITMSRSQVGRRTE